MFEVSSFDPFMFVFAYFRHLLCYLTTGKESVLHDMTIAYKDFQYGKRTTDASMVIGKSVFFEVHGGVLCCVVLC